MLFLIKYQLTFYACIIRWRAASNLFLHTHVTPLAQYSNFHKIRSMNMFIFCLALYTYTLYTPTDLG